VTVPIDEGEAEAQKPEPVVTIRLLDTEQAEQFPRRVRFEVEAERGKRAKLEALLHYGAVRWMQGLDYASAGDPEDAWLDIDGVRCFTSTYTITGWVE